MFRRSAPTEPFIFSTAWTNDQNARAVAEYMNKKGVENVYLIGTNHAAGEENLGGFKDAFKGKLAGEDYTAWPRRSST